MNPAQAKQLLQRDDTFGTTALAIAVEGIGENFLEWDPLAIRLELEESVGPCSGITFNRLMGAVSVLRSDAFFQSLPDFIKIVNALVGGTPPTKFALPDAYDLTWGITEGLLLWPPDDQDDEPFHPEIVGYIREALNREGIMDPPDILRLGLRTDAETLIKNVHAEWSDDPLMYQMIFETNQGKTEEIENQLREDLRALVGQLALVGGDALQEAVPRLLKSLSTANDAT